MPRGERNGALPSPLQEDEPLSPPPLCSSLGILLARSLLHIFFTHNNPSTPSNMLVSGKCSFQHIWVHFHRRRARAHPLEPFVSIFSSILMLGLCFPCCFTFFLNFCRTCKAGIKFEVAGIVEELLPHVVKGISCMRYTFLTNLCRFLHFLVD